MTATSSQQVRGGATPREPALVDADPAVAQAISREEERQRTTLEMIASENFTSRAVLEAVGSVLTNKYAEGYPGRRYYGGCQFIDEVETLARDRAQALFSMEHANVQPHSGAQANLAVYEGLLDPGDPVLGMALDQGGHLTHGHHVNASGKLYRFGSYGVDRESETIDYEAMRHAAQELRPKIVVVGATAYPRIIDFARAREIADEVGAVLMADMAHIAGLVAAGAHPSPAGHAQVLTSSTHKTLRGPRGGLILCERELRRRVDRGVFPGHQGGPLMHVVAGKAVALGEAATPQFAAYQHQTVENARALAETLSEAGLRLVSGGTDNHLILVDVRPKGLTGQEAESALDRCGIIVNKNAIPYDPLPPAVTSGLRIGTPALTSRGLGPQEMSRVGELIASVLEAPADESLAGRVRGEVSEICQRHPAPGLPAP
ncbi:MAG: serine hydroxymethyltransferase [Chloroflexi bacterium]|nr:serine hydroxymethyltransferase [Chloroflexota bacterium]